MLNKSIKFLIKNKLVAFLLLLLFVFWGIFNSPFDFGLGQIPRNPVTVDAIPDLGENQQIVFTEWSGQSPQDIENQITYPLTSHLLGIAGVKTIRSSSMFGFSSIYVIFDEEVDFYWSRSRILEKLSSLPVQVLPDGVTPTLGPDATAMGQIFWYTIEGRDAQGKVTGGWDLHELRSVQDFYVKYGLASTEGVSEVASIGGYIKEYQVDVDPERMRQFNVSLEQVVRAVRESNKDVGAKTLEINKAEYYIRGLGYIKSIEDIENVAVQSTNFTPILVKDIANITIGPEERRGILDKGGAEVVGGVVVSRYGANPSQVIHNLKKKIDVIAPGLPSKTLKDGRQSTLHIIPFYDRTQLIDETLGTLGDALNYEILITILVVIVMMFNLRVSLMISGLLPVAILMVFIAMKFYGIEANIVALSGIAIAIGTIVDMGIILSENIIRHLDQNPDETDTDKVVYKATKEVSGAILTAGLTTIVSFIPVFTLTGAEGKLFAPLAFTKTAALAAALFITLFLLPPFAALVFRKYNWVGNLRSAITILIFLAGSIFIGYGYFVGLVLIGFALINFLTNRNKLTYQKANIYRLTISVLTILILLGIYWRPLGYGNSGIVNIIFVMLLSAGVLGIFVLFKKNYVKILSWALHNKKIFLGLPLILILFGISILVNTGKEFMPSLDEGSFLLMPSSLPHSGVSENMHVIKQLDMAVSAIPEVQSVLGKAGRAESALDPAPLSMYENIIFYKPEYILNEKEMPIAFKTNQEGLFATKNGDWITSGSGASMEELIPDRKGSFYRNWRSSIKSKEDIWRLISEAALLPGVTGAPKLQPIETRMVMLQTGMRSPMGIKVRGQNLEQIEEFGYKLETILKEVKGINNESVFAERITGKPYLFIALDRLKIARYELSVEAIQEVLEIAIGGKVVTQTIEGRERYGVRVRYPRELRGSPEDLGSVYVALKDGGNIPLDQLVTLEYQLGPQMIKSEDGFYVGYIVFDKEPNTAEVSVINEAKGVISEKLEKGELSIPSGINYNFSGTYENQIHAERTLTYVIPLVLLAIFLILYFQFRSVSIGLMVFLGVTMAFAGGFIMIWLYGQSWFMDFEFAGLNARDLFNIKTIHLSVAVWVGFIALFGIATDDGVVMATYLTQVFEKNNPKDKDAIRQSVIEAGMKRVRPCLMTTATTILALLPVLTSKGRGSDIMISMAIPCFGGMSVALITLFVVPILFSWRKESLLNK